MRLRLRLTIDLTRKRAETTPVDKRPVIYDVSGAAVERAETPPLGFTIPRPPGTDPLYGEDDR